MDLRELIAAVNNDIGNLQSGVQSRELRNVDLLYQCDHVEPPVEEEKAAAAVSDEDLLKKLSPPLTGTSCELMWPPPRHVAECPREEEPLNETKEGIIPMMMAHDAKRAHNPSAVMNRVVFDSIEPNPSRQAPQEAAAGQPVPYYELESADDATLIFESRFESGNLRRAIQIFSYEYDLILRPDINTRGHTQWFYFSVKNMKRGRRYKFNIINMMKPDSVYNQGLRPLVYSEKEAEKGTGWHRTGTDIAYYPNSLKRKSGTYFTLTFTVTFQHEDDLCYLAHCYPFTFTDLNLHLTRLEADPARASTFRRRTLCQTLAGNNCEILTITSSSSDLEEMKARRGILLTARVHPGESQSSWMMKGVIDFLTGPSLDAKILRDNFVFKVIPMLNPDGVINGNYRCSLSGQDLNRQWLSPSRSLHPTIFFTKMLLKRLTQEREVAMYCDLHGHSRKKNVFIYGCDNKARGSQHLRLRERIFPRLLWQNSECFSFTDCSFKVQRCKEATGRVVVRREFDILNSFTLECSFAGTNFGAKAGQHMKVEDLERMGAVLCSTLLDLWDPDQSAVEAIHKELLLLYPEDDKDLDSSGEDSSSDDDLPSKSGKGKGKGGKQRGKQEETLPGMVQRAIEARSISHAPASSKSVQSILDRKASRRLTSKEKEEAGRAGGKRGDPTVEVGRSSPAPGKSELAISYSRSLMSRITESINSLAPDMTN
mmetsp:Transcript_18907/g.62144  ORF Transcript_18907/g.62144 Transcript_18907/m.62144 type:complete len:711 (-) Transcript_18907:2680-4812(-)